MDSWGGRAHKSLGSTEGREPEGLGVPRGQASHGRDPREPLLSALVWDPGPSLWALTDSSPIHGFSAGRKLSGGWPGCADSWAHRWKGDQVIADEDDDDDTENVNEQAVTY